MSWSSVSSPEQQFRAWKHRWKREMESFWSGRLWLTSRSPTRDYRLVPVHCLLEIQLVQTAVHSHLNLSVRRLHESEGFFQSEMLVGGCCKNSVEDGLLDHLDLERKPSGQIGAVHELGHYIGLDHVAYGSATPYGNNAWQRGDIMGAGTRLDGWHAWPRQHRLRLHEPSRPPMGLYPPGVEWRGTTLRPA